MYKLMGMLRRTSDLSHDEFVSYWSSQHAPLAARIPGLRKYRLNPIVETFEGGEAYDGYGELWFDDKAAFEAAISSTEWHTTRQDVPNFKSSGPLYLCAEQIEVVRLGRPQ